MARATGTRGKSPTPATGTPTGASAAEPSTSTEAAKDQAQAKAGEVKDQAQEKVRDLAGEARGRLVEQVDQRSTQAGTQVGTVAGDVRSVAEELRKQGKDGPARLADQAAERADKLGCYLEESEAERILHDIEEFGRRQPWAVVAGGLAAGFLSSRFLKASSQTRYRSAYGGERSGGSQPGHASPVTGAPYDPRAL